MSERNHDDDGAGDDMVPLGMVLEGIQARTADVAADTAAELMKLNKRTQPCALDAERAVLCALLLDGECFDLVDEQGLQAGDFYRPQHRTIFATIEMLHAAGEKIDTLVVVDALLAQGKLDYVGGAAAIAQLEALLHTTAHAGAYAKLIRQKAILRKLIVAAVDVVESAYAQNKAPAEVIQAAERAILAASRTAVSAEVVDLDATLERVTRDGIEGKKPQGMVSTGLRDLDPVLRGGFRRGQFVLLAARPGMGKTSLCVGLLRHQAAHVGPVGMISLEMTADELAETMLCQESKLAPEAWESRFHAPRLLEARQRLHNAPIKIIDRAGLTIAEVCSAIRRLHSQFGIVAVYVDHLGKIRPSDRYQGKRADEVREISQALDAVADQLRIPVIALSQLNREIEHRHVKRPNLSDLRDSGALEEDADTVIFVHRPGYYAPNDPDVDQRLAELIVAKNRGGRVTDVNAIFDGPTRRFMNRQQQGSV